MRYLGAVIISFIALALVYFLNKPLGSLPALGKLLDPVNGWAANAENEKGNFSRDFELEGLHSPVKIYFEQRRVPHIVAHDDHDLYYVQGYLHAYFRLWQMDMQTRAASGRISEVVGEKWGTDTTTGKKKNVILEFDRGQRRKGMVYGAENKLKAIEAQPETKAMLDAYTAGINHYIRSLKPADYPLEYKLMGFAPELWTNLKCALMIMNMADDLTGYTEDFQLSALRDYLPKETFDNLYPLRTPGSIPVIPSGTKFNASMSVPPQPEGDLWTHFSNSKSKVESQTLQQNQNYSTDIGSNNWAISGAKTQNGAPILCNDPHLNLNLPSLWFEMQLQSNSVNVYGVSLPGAPGIVIGFNDSISWGLTNNYRDVKDFYEIETIDKNSYRFDGKQVPFDKRVEIIKIKGKPDFIDKVNYTIHGPVIYDSSYKDPLQTKKQYAVCWMAHRASNELYAIYLLNRAKNYNEYTKGLYAFECPAQNFVYADRAGNIAMNGQGRFINKWKDQGRYVMNGNTSATLWGKDIPMNENPHVLNPPQEYLASANQMTTDSTYPYWYNGYFSDFREWEINKKVKNDDTILFTTEGKKYLPINTSKQMSLQNNTHSLLFERLLLGTSIFIYPRKFNYWLGDLLKDDSNATRFQILWSFLYKNIWEDEFLNIPHPLYPKEEITMQLLLTDSTSKFYDDKRTPQIETLKDIVQRSFRQTQDSLDKLKKQLGTLEWYKVKGTQLTHLAKIDAFSYKDLKIGGWGNTINAVKKTHGPSWRMIVEMGKDSIRAYGVYPGGQSGNPGSKFYGNFVDKWVNGKYYNLLFIGRNQKPTNAQTPYVWNVSQ